MAQQTIKIKLILGRNFKDNSAQIIARIRISRTKVEFNTGRSVAEENWSPQMEKLIPDNRGNKEINAYLESFRNRIFMAYSSLLSTGEEVSAEKLKQTVYGEQVKKKFGLIEVAQQHNTEFEKLVGYRYCQGSYKNYKTTLKYLIEFIPQQYKKKDLLLDDVDYKFCESYYTFLTMKKTCTNNGANKQIQRVKKIVNYAIKHGYTSRNHMAAYQLHFKPVNKIALTMNEIDKLACLPLQRSTLAQVRDVFIFQCYTGLSYSDLKGLRPDHIHTNDDGSLWIRMERQKTEISFMVPLLMPAIELVKKYLNTSTVGPVFPVLSNQKMNDSLKIIQEIAGISKNLTTHLARHSFATTITLNNDVPIETVSRMMGHTNLRTTQLYAKVLDGKINSDMDKLKDKLNKS